MDTPWGKLPEDIIDEEMAAEQARHDEDIEVLSIYVQKLYIWGNFLINDYLGFCLEQTPEDGHKNYYVTQTLLSSSQHRHIHAQIGEAITKIIHGADAYSVVSDLTQFMAKADIADETVDPISETIDAIDMAQNMYSANQTHPTEQADAVYVIRLYQALNAHCTECLASSHGYTNKNFLNALNAHCDEMIEALTAHGHDPDIVMGADDDRSLGIIDEAFQILYETIYKRLNSMRTLITKAKPIDIPNIPGAADAFWRIAFALNTYGQFLNLAHDMLIDSKAHGEWPIFFEKVAIVHLMDENVNADNLPTIESQDAVSFFIKEALKAMQGEDMDADDAAIIALTASEIYAVLKNESTSAIRNRAPATP